MKHCKTWQCTEGHGLIQEYADPEYFETRCECGRVTKHYVNHVEEGQRCRWMSPMACAGDPITICQGVMTPVSDEVSQ